jgi:hypothetical protein
MALALPWLLAAVALVFGGGGLASVPTSGIVESVVARITNETAARVAARRGVRLTRPLEVRLVDRPQMTAVRDSLSDQAPTPPRRILFDHLGLLDTDLMGPARPPTSPQPEITGLYDPTHEQLLVANWADLADGRFASIRDVAEVLLDRRFGLSRWLTVPGAVNFDATLARQAIVYGDATAQALEDLDPQVGLPSPRALAAIAEQLRSQFAAERAEAAPLDVQSRLFVELDGLTFVARIRARSPWRAVDEVWRHPVESSEQILHPEKYERGEKPDNVDGRLSDRADLAPLRRARDRSRIVYRDTLGEFGTRLFLGRAGDPYRAERAAAGWGGDRALLLRRGDAPESASETRAGSFVAWLTTWDDDTNAEDFAVEAAHAVAALAGAPLRDDRPASGQVRITDASGRLFAINHQRRVVGLLLDAPASAGDLLARLMSAVSLPGPSRRRGAGQGRGMPR